MKTTNWEDNICPHFDLRSNLQEAFEYLNEIKIIAKHDWWCCQSCGGSAIAQIQGKEDLGYVFYHDQDVEKCAMTGFIYLAYGGFIVSDKFNIWDIHIGHIVCDILNKHGIKTEWDGIKDSRIKAFVGKCPYYESREHEGDYDY